MRRACEPWRFMGIRIMTPAPMRFRNWPLLWQREWNICVKCCCGGFPLMTRPGGSVFLFPWGAIFSWKWQNCVRPDCFGKESLTPLVETMIQNACLCMCAPHGGTKRSPTLTLICSGSRQRLLPPSAAVATACTWARLMNLSGRPMNFQGVLPGMFRSYSRMRAI